jgi:hypothetical protein
LEILTLIPGQPLLRPLTLLPLKVLLLLLAEGRSTTRVIRLLAGLIVTKMGSWSVVVKTGSGSIVAKTGSGPIVAESGTLGVVPGSLLLHATSSRRFAQFQKLRANLLIGLLEYRHQAGDHLSFRSWRNRVRCQLGQTAFVANSLPVMKE